MKEQARRGARPARYLPLALSAQRLSFPGRLAIGVKRLGGDLCHLPAGGGVVRAEVGPVGRRDTWLAYSPAGIALDDAPRGHALGIQVEGLARWHVLEGLAGRRLRPSCRPAGDLAQLPAGDIVVRAEVG